MSKKDKKRTRSNKARSPYAEHNLSGINQHKKEGSKLIPPLMQISNLKPSSWSDDHMPEMLWAVLLTGVLKREDYLTCFRRLAGLCREWFIAEDDESQREGSPHRGHIGCTAIVDQTKLSQISDDQFRLFISVITKHPLGYAALRPLLFFESLPAITRWRSLIGVQPMQDDWDTLARAVAGVLDHQSEASTDIRWFKAIVGGISGRMQFPDSMKESLEDLRLFPTRGDMRQVRPFIRSMEMTIRRHPVTLWVSDFWKISLTETKCIDPSHNEHYEIQDIRLDLISLYSARDYVIKNFFINMSATRSDARLDSAFGLALYALSILQEIAMHRIHTRIIGLLSLRCLVELLISLKYLVHQDSPALWQSYRVYGAGQAKLAFLKAREIREDLPSFLDETLLHNIANEDIWQEFLSIDVGNWANSDLRKMSISCDAKDLYDKYYGWTSSFTHGSWGAVRDTNFVTCHNPLHRLHRIPRTIQRTMASVEPDAVELVNQILAVIDCYFHSEDTKVPFVSLKAGDC